MLNKNKLAQKIIVNLYLRYRLNRKLRKQNPRDISLQSAKTYLNQHYLSVETESWNALQASKQIYYNA